MTTKQTKQIDPDDVAQRATYYFVEKRKTCSEACLMAGAEALGIESPLLPEIAIAFAGGIGMQGDVCGAVPGCHGLVAGRRSEGEGISPAKGDCRARRRPLVSNVRRAVWLSSLRADLRA